MSGRRTHGRWTPTHRLGRGGFSEVWAVEDPTTGEQAALKLLRLGEHQDRRRIEREIACLRRLAIPGVVRLIESFREDERWCIVMERVDGAPFPGPDRDRTWEAVRPAAVGLLRVLARIHAQGLLHRDLKPANVLADDRGRVTLLDFGLARSTSGGDTVTRAGWVLGTRGYLSPERSLGAAPSPADDLFAVGVMIYEALVGRPPWPREAPPGPRSPPAPRVDQDGSTVPSAVADVVADLLAVVAERRLSDAARAADRLEATKARSFTLPFLGQAEALRVAETAVSAGRSVRIAAAAGMGRRRFQAELMRRLRHSDLRPVQAPGGGRPLASARAALETLLPEDAATRPLPASLDEMLERTRAELATVAEQGGVVFTDSASPPDRWSGRLLGELPGVHLVEGDAQADAALSPLDSDDLRPLFAGPDRVLFLVTDAVDALMARTAGVPARVAAEVRAWEDAGWVSRRDDRLHIDRARLDHLRSGPPTPLSVPPRAPLPDALDPDARRLLGWLERSAASLPAATLARLMESPGWMVDAWLEELRQLGLVVTGETGWRLAAPLGLAFDADPLAAAGAHSRLADELPPGAATRLHHLLQAGRREDAIEEALGQAAALSEVGRLGAALATLEDVVGLAADSSRARAVAAALAGAALARHVPARVHAAREAVSRLGQRDIETLLDAWSTFLDRGVPGREPVPLPEPDLEDWRLGLQVQVATRSGAQSLPNAVVDTLASGPTRVGPRTAARRATWAGQLAYREGRYAEAAHAHEEAARLAPARRYRANALINSASAWMEAGDLAASRDRVDEAFAILIELRAPFRIAQAHCVARAVAYRSGDPGPPDADLVDAIEQVGQPWSTALVALNEAAVAWRQDQPELARALATRAAEAFDRAGLPPGRLLARALAVRTGSPIGDGERWDLAHQVDLEAKRAPLPGIWVQVYGLLAPPGAAGAPFRSIAATFVDGWSPSELQRRLEVLSAAEALQG